MSVTIRRVQYLHTTAADRPGSAYQILDELAKAGVNLLAFSCVPVGPTSVQITLFPEDLDRLESEATSLGLELSTPHLAFLVQGKDELGALADVHRRLFDIDVNVYASTGVVGSSGHFGYVIYLRPEDYERAATVLSV